MDTLLIRRKISSIAILFKPAKFRNGRNKHQNTANKTDVAVIKKRSKIDKQNPHIKKRARKKSLKREETRITTGKRTVRAARAGYWSWGMRLRYFVMRRVNLACGGYRSVLRPYVRVSKSPRFESFCIFFFSGAQ